ATPNRFTRDVELDRVDHIGSARIDFYGAMAGVEYRRRYDVQGPKPRGLEFSTTLALRYARGRGSIQGAWIEPLVSAPNDYRPIATDATIHEINLHIGSALYF